MSRAARRLGRVSGVALAGTLLAGGLLSPAAAGPTSAPAARTTTAAGSGLQGLLDELVANGATGVLARVDDGRRVRSYASGTVRIGSGRPETVGARFRVGSITKTFVATVALQLVGEGRLSLSDPVSRWLPGLVPGGDAVTMRMLLNHTSGIFDYTQDPQWLATVTADRTHVWTPQELVAVAVAHPALFAPGTSWSYSNTNYILAGLVIEAAGGRPLQTQIQRRIIGPLHLRATSFPTRTPYINGYHAHGYIPPSLLPPGSRYFDVTAFSPTSFGAAGALISTAADLTRFHSALLGGRLLRPAELHQMETTVAVDPTLGYGLGLFSSRGPCGTVWGHNGHVPGYFSFAYNDRVGRRSVVINMSTEADSRTGPLLDLSVSTAICQMFGVLPAGRSGSYSAPTVLRAPLAALGAAARAS